tara:strand:- start:1501 stop:1707 length:207 start_codon:yes stop_codon:yes gene_type:complete
MKQILSTRGFKLIITLIILAMNIAWYTLGYPATGFNYAWDVSPIFGIFLSSILGGAFWGYVYFDIKNV